MISISSFKSAVKSIARPNRFAVTVDSPPDVIDISSDNIYLIQDAALPNRSVGDIPVKYAGQTLHLPGDYEHTDLTIKVINNMNWEIRSFFERWQEYIQKINGNNNRSDSQNTLNQGQVHVHQLGLSGPLDIIATYTFYNAFPKEVGEIRLSMSENDSIELFDVTFAYSHWKKTK